MLTHYSFNNRILFDEMMNFIKMEIIYFLFLKLSNIYLFIYFCTLFILRASCAINLRLYKLNV